MIIYWMKKNISTNIIFKMNCKIEMTTSNALSFKLENRWNNGYLINYQKMKENHEIIWRILVNNIIDRTSRKIQRKGSSMLLQYSTNVAILLSNVTNVLAYSAQHIEFHAMFVWRHINFPTGFPIGVIPKIYPFFTFKVAVLLV